MIQDLYRVYINQIKIAEKKEKNFDFCFSGPRQLGPGD